MRAVVGARSGRARAHGPARLGRWRAAAPTEGAPHGGQAEHPDHLGRRHRGEQPELLQRRGDGLPDPPHRPHRRRGGALHRLLRRAELHGGSRGVHHRPEPVPHGPDQGRDAWHGRRAEGRGPHDRDGSQGARLRHGAVRQEPLRRPRRVPPHHARLRRVLRQPLPPQRRGGARARRLPARGGLPRLPQELRPAGRHPLVGERRRHAAHRGHRSADEGADEDHRRRGRPRGAAVHDRRPGRRHPVLRLAQHHAHALPHPCQGRQPRPGRPVAVGVPRHDVRPRRPGRRRPGVPRRQRAGRGHDRHVLDRQRSPHELLARCRHDAVPEREELELGGRVPGAGGGAVARTDPGRHGAERDRQSQRLVRHPPRRGR